MEPPEWSWMFAGQEGEQAAGRPAVVQPNKICLDYRQLKNTVKQLGATLLSCDLRLEDTVAVVMPDGAAGLVTQLGVMGVCACAPLNAALTETELRYDLAELGVKALICAPEFDGGVRIAAEMDLVLILASIHEDGLVWQPQPTTEQVSRVHTKSNNGAAILLHTSATTGRRKIVPLSRANLEAACANTRGSLGLTQQDRLLVLARIFHAQAILSALAQWGAGGTVIVPDNLELGFFTRWITDLQVTWYTCGPTLHQAILTELRKQPLTPPHTLRVVRSGGNTLSPALKAELQQQLGVPVLDMYGLSETGAVAADELAHPGMNGWKSVGPQIRILSQAGDALPAGEEGEIAVRGASVMSGYWNDEDANRDAFWGAGEERWFRTGDLGRLDAAGTLTMSGRAKEIINRGGQKIKPSEIDLVLSRHPAIRIVAAFAVPHPTLGEDVACAAVLKEGWSATEAELQAFARRSLAYFKIPRRVHWVTSIPLGATGKPQRLVLRDQLGTRAMPEPEAGAFSSERTLSRLERAIAELWSGRLHVLQIKLEDDFFHLGGDSLEAVSMLSEVETLLEKTMPPGAVERFFEAPTIAMLSGLLSAPVKQTEAATQSEHSHAMRLYPLLSDGAGIEAFLFPADDEEGWYFRLLSRYLGKQRRMSMLRPEDGVYPPGPQLVETASAQAVTLIRERQPHGPYLVGGFCLGGVIAYETARLLELAGETVLLLLFDSPMPGAPYVNQGRQYGRELIERVGAARRGERTWRRVVGFPLYVLRRWLWLALSKTKAHWHGLAGSAPLRWLRRQAEHDYLPLYLPPPSRLPILHFSTKDGRDGMRRSSVRAWRYKTPIEPRLIPLPGSHHSLFSETNLGHMTEATGVWVDERLGNNSKGLSQAEVDSFKCDRSCCADKRKGVAQTAPPPR